MRNIFTLAFVSFVLLGCAVDHESIGVSSEQDFFGPVPVVFVAVVPEVTGGAVAAGAESLPLLNQLYTANAATARRTAAAIASRLFSSPSFTKPLLHSANTFEA